MATSFDYSGWTNLELQRARATAQAYLTTHQTDVQRALAAQCRVLVGLIENLGSTELTFEDQLDCLAHIGDVSQIIRDSAQGFFDLGCQPVVAQTLVRANAEDSQA